MARINKNDFFEEENQTSIKEQKFAISRYYLGTLNEEKIIQINMYGSKYRKETKPPHNHKTQVIQINKDTAIFLINLFKKHFNL